MGLKDPRPIFAEENHRLHGTCNLLGIPVPNIPCIHALDFSVNLLPVLMVLLSHYRGHNVPVDCLALLTVLSILSIGSDDTPLAPDHVEIQNLFTNPVCSPPAGV